ncbi:ribonuclease P protein component [Persephonella sp.]
MYTLKNREIKEILSKGRKIQTEHFIVIYRKNNLGYPRFAFIVSKKFSKKAVIRNRTKRILREAIRYFYKYLANLNCDIIFIAKKNILGKKTTDLLQDMELLISNLREENGQSFNKEHKTV